MSALILGLLLFFATHSARIFAEDTRSRLIARHGLAKWKLDLLDDHSIKHYADHIVKAIEAEVEDLAKGEGPTRAADVVISGAESDEASCDSAPA